MILDFLIMPPIILTTMLGLRDGIVRKGVAILATVAALYFGQVFMHQAGSFYIENFEVEQSSAPVYGFMSVFSLVLVIQSLFYHLVTKNYKMGGIIDRVGGSFLGFVQGIIFMSCLLWIFSLQGVPSPKTAKQSELYRPVVNVAPQILDMFSNIGTETEVFLQGRATPGSELDRESLRRPGLRDTTGRRSE
ncbi:MAG: CvpA family protein [Ignavibacteriales bacterium]|nr:CvpA family protein [Ignavibacteriales bacterium]